MYFIDIYCDYYGDDFENLLFILLSYLDSTLISHTRSHFLTYFCGKVQ